jgi:hypothetical protein
LRRHLTLPQNEQSLHPDSFWWNISQNTNCSYANLGAPETTQYKLRANLVGIKQQGFTEIEREKDEAKQQR